MPDRVIVENLSPEMLWLYNQDREQLVEALGDHPGTSWGEAIERVEQLAREERAWQLVPTLRRKVIEAAADRTHAVALTWDYAHEIDGVCSGDASGHDDERCGDPRMAFVDGDCRVPMTIGWSYSEANASYIGSEPCTCSKCAPFWSAPNCQDIDALVEGGAA